MDNRDYLKELNAKYIKSGKIDAIKIFVLVTVMEAIVPYIMLFITGFQTTTLKGYIISTVVRLSIWWFSFYFIWTGRRWARILTGIYFLGASLLLAIVFMANKYYSSGVLLFYVAVYVALGLFSGMAILTAKNMRKFFDYQRTKRLMKNKLMPNVAKKYPFDVAISFAGQDREIAEQLSDHLIELGLTVFYDKLEEHKLLGKNLFQYLQEIYKDSAQTCIVLISQHYMKKPWTLHELEQIQARIFEARVNGEIEYLLPVRIDDTEIPGINSIIGYLDIREKSISEVAKIIYKKICEE
ncbi:TIR domain-containing protein [Pasteurella skyensis]|uniref:TIR domain-containing protein n=1 Tax=Phocoenobacter skyensis TaxID=97481 RepID=A0AAJ6NAQ3_9PAST|nr:TIR domain-containing protein [Pasteurella skyensis]MDP8163226.1 TIR domain-containing protein [Pasteurella skyensis]MDP8173307.1 TIR domain-containing protein [Pasteurella skyensis]MDP8176988.1 TIR domain-containing protein [Pasteurella skyensis]MDP8179717.1 TIR domain-containing protein [Pasteurella skyensis]MDP8182690.1 TIR domain-containing protein [Pasteurella skyensis]